MSELRVTTIDAELYNELAKHVRSKFVKNRGLVGGRNGVRLIRNVLITNNLIDSTEYEIALRRELKIKGAASIFTERVVDHHAHPALNAAIGTTIAAYKGGDIPIQGITKLGEIVDAFTPDAKNLERRAVLEIALGQIGVSFETTGEYNCKSQELVHVQGTIIPLPLTRNHPELEYQRWRTPYAALVQ